MGLNGDTQNLFTRLNLSDFGYRNCAAQRRSLRAVAKWPLIVETNRAMKSKDEPSDSTQETPRVTLLGLPSVPEPVLKPPTPKAEIRPEREKPPELGLSLDFAAFSHAGDKRDES